MTLNEGFYFMEELKKKVTEFLNLLTPKIGEKEALHTFNKIELHSLIRVLIGAGIINQEVFEKAVILELRRFLEDNQNDGKI